MATPTPRASVAAATPRASVAASPASASSCRVVARFRPLTARERGAEGGGARCVECGAAGGAQVAVTAPGSAEPLPFAFDAVLPEASTQEEVFACVARETVDRVQQGYNGARARALREPAQFTLTRAHCRRQAR
jgi:hypothetical protein